jgi:hypothetical protein
VSRWTLFLACCDPARLDRLEAELGEIGRALRTFVPEDDELAWREWADTVAATALDDLER